MIDTTIPSGSLVLVTGASGYIASHVVDTFLSEGFNVRGTFRTHAKLARFEKVWEEKYGKGKFEGFVVEDMQADGAFDEAVKGVSGIAHIATVTSLSTDPAAVVDPTVAGTLSILRSASTQPSIKRFVLTSSSIAAYSPKPNEVYDIKEDTWNEDSINLAFVAGEDPLKPLHVYAVSKILGEQAAWKFVKDEKPSFVLNTILPNVNFGPSIIKGDTPSTLGWLKVVYDGELGILGQLSQQWFVDVRDTARVHVHALTSPTLSYPGARIWSIASPLSINELLRIFRRDYPEREFVQDIDEPENLSKIDNGRATKLLGKWIGLEESVRDTIKML